MAVIVWIFFSEAVAASDARRLGMVYFVKQWNSIRYYHLIASIDYFLIKILCQRVVLVT